MAAAQDGAAEVAIMRAGVLGALPGQRLDIVEDVEPCAKLLGAWRDHSHASAHSLIHCGAPVDANGQYFPPNV